MFFRLAIVISASVLFTGCATITHDSNQSVQLETVTKDEQRVLGARCVAKNERGSWEVTTPGTVSVHRSSENLIVTCEKSELTPGVVTAISRANGGMFGNIIAGGGIGAIIDHNKGTAYNYPTWLRVIMGENVVVDRRDQSDENAPAPIKKPDAKTAENTESSVKSQ